MPRGGYGSPIETKLPTTIGANRNEMSGRLWDGRDIGQINEVHMLSRTSESYTIMLLSTEGGIHKLLA